MGNIYLLFFFVLVPILLQAQVKPAFDTKISPNKNTWLIRPMSINVVNRYSESVYNPIDTSKLDSINISLKDTLKYNMYGDLLNDNPLYNPKTSLVVPSQNSIRIKNN